MFTFYFDQTCSPRCSIVLGVLFLTTLSRGHLVIAFLQSIPSVLPTQLLYFTLAHTCEILPRYCLQMLSYPCFEKEDVLRWLLE